MINEEKNITLTSDEWIFILSEIEFFLISLMKIGGYYYVEENKNDESKFLEYSVETARFVEKNKLTQRLTKIKEILIEKTDFNFGEKDKKYIERVINNVVPRKKQGD